MKKNDRRAIIIFVGLFIILFVLTYINIVMGSINVPAKELWHILTGVKTGGDDAIMNPVYKRVIIDIRIPRIIAAIVLGGGLALSGYMLQTFFHNPIAGPFVLGISSGAKLMVAVFMVLSAELGFYADSISIIGVAFFGSLIVTLIVLLFSSKVKQMSILIVCGVMVGYISSAITELIISLADDANIVNLHNWAMGSFSAMDWDNVKIFAPVTCICLVIAIFMGKSMEAYYFGENYAKSLGVNIKIFRVMLILISSVLSATVTAFAGPVSFVGIAVPHIMRELLKSDRPQLIIPASFIGGGIFCLLSDLLARCIVAPMELSISTMTAIFGAPVVIVMILKRKRR